MMKTLIKKEILNHLLSFRFLVTLVLLLIVVPATVVVLSNDTLRGREEYSRRQGEIERYMEKYAHFNRVHNIVAPSLAPLPFHALIRGISAEINQEEFDNDPLPQVFPLTDFTWIINVLMSLAALIFSYDSLCGEREEGTLKLLLSHSVSRASVVFSKLVGGLIALAVPLTASLLLGALWIALTAKLGWTIREWLALGVILVASLLYILFFYTLGLFLSCRHESSSSSILTALFVWVFFILVVPALSPYVASFLSPTPSRIKLDRELSRIYDTDRDELGRKLTQEVRKKMQEQYPILLQRLSPEEEKRRIASDPEYSQAYKRLTEETAKAWAEANRIQGAKAEKLEKEQERKEKVQTKLSVALSLFSPLSAFTYVATELSSTGINNDDRFVFLREKWHEEFEAYRDKRMALLRAQDPQKDWWNTPVKMDDRPRFVFRELSLRERVKNAALPLFLLFLLDLVVMVAAVRSFLGYDVR